MFAQRHTLTAVQLRTLEPNNKIARDIVDDLTAALAEFEAVAAALEGTASEQPPL